MDRDKNTKPVATSSTCSRYFTRVGDWQLRIRLRFRSTKRERKRNPGGPPGGTLIHHYLRGNQVKFSQWQTNFIRLLLAAAINFPAARDVYSSFRLIVPKVLGISARSVLARRAAAVSARFEETRRSFQKFQRTGVDPAAFGGRDERRLKFQVYLDNLLPDTIGNGG